MNKIIRWGVIGSGGIAKRRTIPEGIVPAANAELVAAFDVNLTASAEVAKQFGARAAASIDELLLQDLDAVYIATPPNVHREQTLACARAGKHVLCEKPLALTVADAASQNRLELYGSLGSILAQGTIGQGAQGEMTAFLQQGAGGYDAQQARDANGGTRINPLPVNPYHAEIEEFSQAILDNREPSNTAAIGLQSQRVLAACYESARTGIVREINPSPPQKPHPHAQTPHPHAS